MTPYVVEIDGSEYTVRPTPTPDKPNLAKVSYPDGYATFYSVSKATGQSFGAMRYNVRMAARAYLEWLEARESTS